MLEPGSLEGILFPWKNGLPVLVNLPGSQMFYLPCFSSEDLLTRTLEAGGVLWDSIRTLEDTEDFVLGVYEMNPRVKIILDLHQTREGTLRFSEVVRTLH
jgi:hypothetical protein